MGDTSGQRRLATTPSPIVGASMCVGLVTWLLGQWIGWNLSPTLTFAAAFIATFLFGCAIASSAEARSRGKAPRARGGDGTYWPHEVPDPITLDEVVDRTRWDPWMLDFLLANSDYRRRFLMDRDRLENRSPGGPSAPNFDDYR